MEPDITTIAKGVLDFLKGELGKGFASIKDYAEFKSRELATQAAGIARSRVSGVLRTDRKLLKFSLEQLAESTKSFALHVIAKTVLTLEKAWNGLVNSLWGAINQFLDVNGLGMLRFPGVPGF